VVARCNTLKYNNYHQYNATIQCIFNEDNSALSSGLDYQWMAIPNILYSLSLLTLNIGGLEFIVSQTPYSMRGLLMGSAYGIFALFAVLTAAVSFPFTKMPSLWGRGIISCGFWYALLLGVAAIAVGIILGIMMKFYKKRKREDVLPNEHIFAERYYAKEN
jgi:NADH:ubiquinone oxidoreductase subunit K